MGFNAPALKRLKEEWGEITYYRHEILHLNHPVNTRAMDRNCDSHDDHMPWSFGDASIGRSVRES